METGLQTISKITTETAQSIPAKLTGKPTTRFTASGAGRDYKSSHHSNNPRRNTTMNQILKALIMGTQRKLRMQWLALMALAMLLASDVFGVAVSIHGDFHFYKHSTIRFNEVILFEGHTDAPNCDSHYVEDWPVFMDLYKTYTISWATTADYGPCFSGGVRFPHVSTF